MTYTPASALIRLAREAGAPLRLSLACDDVTALPPHLLAEIQAQRQEIIQALAAEASPPVPAQRPKYPLHLRARPPRWRSTDAYDDMPKKGDFCQACSGSMFYRLAPDWACSICLPQRQHLSRNDVVWTINGNFGF